MSYTRVYDLCTILYRDFQLKTSCSSMITSVLCVSVFRMNEEYCSISLTDCVTDNPGDNV